MTEIDFDELDKAVSSLMTKSSASQATVEKPEAAKVDSQTDEIASVKTPQQTVEPEPQTKPAESVPDTSDTSASVEVPEVAVEPVVATEKTDAEPEKPEESQPVASEAASAVQPQTVVAPTVAASVPLATKRRGQFMDMKHPSANMQSPKPVPSPISRQGSTIKPLTQSEPAATEQQAIEAASEPETPVEVPVVPAAPGNPEVATEPSAAGPIETPEDTESHSVVDDLPDISEDELTSKNDTVLTSPFLPDAKVEKRPLGGTPVVAPEPMDENFTESTEDSAQKSDETLTHDHEPIEPEHADTLGAETHTASELPKELHESVMQVESDTTNVQGAQQTSTEQTTGSNDAGASGAVGAAAVQQASIPQQYKTKNDEKSDDDEPATLYGDAPLPLMPKKKSHFGVILAIVGLLLLGAAAGAVLYMMQTGAL